MKTLLLPLFMAALLCAGCNQSSAPDAAATSKAVLEQLAGQSWKLDRWTDADGAAQEAGAITLAVGDNFHISGHASVNRYMGVAAFAENGALDLGKMATTMMMGLPEAMEREALYLSDLKLVSKASLVKDRLILSGSGKLRLEFTPAP